MILLDEKIILGIETSCDDTCVALIRGRNVLSNIIISQETVHNKFGGVEPEHAARTHCKMILEAYEKALSSSGVSEDFIDYIAVTKGPGLVGSLMVGNYFAIGLSIRLNKPLIGIDHLFAHILVNRMTQNIDFPFLGGLFSGGHSFILNCKSPMEFEIIGTTMDDAMGECFDKVGKEMNLPFPGGRFVEQLAQSGTVQEGIITVPLRYVKTCDFSFSGLKTHIIRQIRKKRYSYEDIAASFQHIVYLMLEKSILIAIKKTKYKSLVLGGGVIANNYIKNKIQEFCDKRKVKLFYPNSSLTRDNGVMIAWNAYEILIMEKRNMFEEKDLYVQYNFSF